MKHLFFLFFIVHSFVNSYGQQIAPAPRDKAVVYFARPSIFGFVVEFFYYDSTNFIAKVNNTNYVRYECEPGSHLFWAKSENTVFLEADLEPGKIYFIEVRAVSAIPIADVELNAVDPSKDEKAMNRILKLMEKKSPLIMTTDVIAKESDRMKKTIDQVMEKYRKRKESGKKIERLEKTMYYKP